VPPILLERARFAQGCEWRRRRFTESFVVPWRCADRQSFEKCARQIVVRAKKVSTNTRIEQIGPGGRITEKHGGTTTTEEYRYRDTVAPVHRRRTEIPVVVEKSEEFVYAVWMRDWYVARIVPGRLRIAFARDSDTLYTHRNINEIRTVHQCDMNKYTM
jgi:hypothetical protein